MQKWVEEMKEARRGKQRGVRASMYLSPSSAPCWGPGLLPRLCQGKALDTVYTLSETKPRLVLGLAVA